MFTEKEVEDFIVGSLSKTETGQVTWQFVPASELDRDSCEDPLLVRTFIRKVRELNSPELTEEDAQTALKILHLKPSTQEGIKAVMNYFKMGIPLTLEKSKSLKYIRLFDYDMIENNDFIVSRQVHYKNGDAHIIVDVILYVNGIPLVNIECKNPASFAEDWTHAFRDIKLYEQRVPELYKYVQIGVAAAETARYFPSVRWQPDNVETDEWKVKDVSDAVAATMQMLKPSTLIDIIKNFLFYRIESGKATKVLPRYMQYRAVNKIVQRVFDHIEGRSAKKKGLVWHWLGSGKTLEMIFAAYKLYYARQMQNPSIFFIVDREELETQLSDEFNALDMIKPEVVGSIDALKGIIRHDNYKGKRGLILTLVHKFRPAELAEVDEEMNKLIASQETLRTRTNVVTFVDEGHRTQYGQLAAQMKKILGEKTNYRFAFTGTPICKPQRGVDTYAEFSYGTEEKYLDKYFFVESIADGFTVKIAYQPALEDVEGIHLDREKLDAFLKGEYEDIPENLREAVKEGVREKLNLIKVYLENPERIGQIAAHIAEHFKSNLDGKFKALVVAVSREATITYKRELDKHLPPEYSEVVISYDDKKDADNEVLSAFKSELKARYKGKEPDDIKKEVVYNFRNSEKMPRILIVKDMLLTGFNAPILQTMYLDQPLKEYKLLQAIARTNRPYKGVKGAGLIIDYIGLLKEFHKAFEIYDKEDIQGILNDTEDLKKEFIEKIRSIQDIFVGLDHKRLDRRTLLKTMEILSSNVQLSKMFITKYRELRRLFELLGADVIKAEMALEYGWITQVYANYSKSISTRSGEEELYIQKYFQKTVDYVHQSTQLKELIDVLPIIEFDEHYLERLNAQVKDVEAKAANMVFTLNRFVLVDKQREPLFETISGRVERLLRMWQERTKNFELIYKEGLSIIHELGTLKKRQMELKLDNLSYQMLLRLEKRFGTKKELVDEVKDLYGQLDKIISIKERKFPNWASQVTVRKNVEKTIRRFIIGRHVKKDNLGLEEVDELFNLLMDDVIRYA